MPLCTCQNIGINSVFAFGTQSLGASGPSAFVTSRPLPLGISLPLPDASALDAVTRVRDCRLHLSPFVQLADSGSCDDRLRL